MSNNLQFTRIYVEVNGKFSSLAEKSVSKMAVIK